MKNKIFITLFRFVSKMKMDLHANNLGINQNMHTLCLVSSIVMLVLNILYVVLMFFYIADHNYTVITETFAVMIVVMMTIGVFVSLSTLYTITLNKDAYVHIRNLFLYISGGYLGLVVIFLLYLVIQAIGTTDSNHWKLFKILILPALGECGAFVAITYGFYYLYSYSFNYKFVLPYQPQIQVPYSK